MGWRGQQKLSRGTWVCRVGFSAASIYGFTVMSRLQRQLWACGCCPDVIGKGPNPSQSCLLQHSRHELGQPVVWYPGLGSLPQPSVGLGRKQTCESFDSVLVGRQQAAGAGLALWLGPEGLRGQSAARPLPSTLGTRPSIQRGSRSFCKLVCMAWRAYGEG